MMNKIYPHLAPKARIQAFIEDHIYPDMQKKAYRFLKSGTSFKKDSKDFTYEIWFRGNHRNSGDAVCSFDVHASIYLRTYGKWYQRNYGEKLRSNILVSMCNSYIPNWTTESGEFSYDLALYDNYKILQSLKHNINNAVLPFLESVTDYYTAIDIIQQDKRYYLTPLLLDFCEIMCDSDKANELVAWFNAEANAGTDFSDETLTSMQVRVERLEAGYRTI